ncbi:MAG: hypothetical protein M3151_11805 [Actinomycetota bacterium]|nr:hypothetical protein [Actinomycetota bacterium]
MSLRGEESVGPTSGDLALADGTVVRVRPVSPGDAPALQRLHGRLSERSIELRFLEPLESCPTRRPPTSPAPKTPTTSRWRR